MASLKDLIVMGPARFLDKLYGNLEGTADRAKADGNGDVFTSTYLKLTGGIISNSIGTNNHHGILQIKNNTTGDIGYHTPLRVMSPSAIGTQLIMVGPSNSEKNAGYLGFYNSGTSGSNNNFLTLGLYAVDNAINIYGSGNIGIWTTTPSYALSVYSKYGSTGCVAEFRSSKENGSYIYFSGDQITTTTGNGKVASVGYYAGLACIANEKTYARIGVTDEGKPNYWNTSTPTDSGKYELIVGNGYLNVGPIKLDNTVKDNARSTHYISAGSGYSTGSGLNGIKLVATEQSDAISGIGQDCTGKAYELSIAAAQGTSGQGYITFVGHKMDSLNTYNELGHFNFSNSVFYVNGKIGIGTTAPSYALHTVGDIYANGGWLRTSGDTGWYNNTHSGGWYMSDATYVRSYSNKAILINNNIYVGTTSGGGTGLSLYGTSSPSTYGLHFSQTSNFGKFGDVQSDWATYFSMNDVGQRGWVYRAGSTNVASISANGVGAFKGIMGETGHVLSPDGGRYTTTSNAHTGYLKITLPVSWNNTMIRFIVDIYNYSTNTSASYLIGGYNYSDSPGWHQCAALCLGRWGYSLSNLDVHFGHDGSKCAIYIGSANTSWSYPQVIVRDVIVGYAQASNIANYSKGWSVGFTTSLGSYITTISNTNMGYSVNYAASAGSANSVAWSNVTGKPSFNYLSTSGGTLSGLLSAHGGISLNSSTPNENLTYILGIRAFADGGNIIWQSASAVSVGYATSAGSSASCTGNAASATQLATARNFTIGGTARSFNGTTAVSWTKSEVGIVSALQNQYTSSTGINLNSYKQGRVTVTSGSASNSNKPANGAQAFTMWNSMILSNGLGFCNDASTWQYVVQFFCDHAANLAVRGISSDGTAGNYTYQSWRMIPYYTGTSTTIGGSDRPIYLKSGALTACSAVGVLYGGTGATDKANAKKNLGINYGASLPTSGMAEGDIFYVITG